MVSSQDRSEDAAGRASVSGRWKERLDDPFNRFYRYPVARLLVRALLPTPITPNQLSFVQPFLAAGAGYFVTFADRRHLVLGALLFELRAVLDCADGTLARARGKTDPSGHAVDAIADWLSTVLLYAGIFWHFLLYPPPVGAWSRYLSVGGVLLLALAQGALRSFAADHYKYKYTSIFEHGHDGPLDDLARKVRALGPGSSIFARVDALIGRAEHLAFEHEVFDPVTGHDGGRAPGHAGGHPRTPNPPVEPRCASVAQLRTREGTPMARLVALLWSVSNGDAFLSLVTISLLTNRLWEGQLFFALAGVPWIVLVVALNARFVRGPASRSRNALGRSAG